MNLNYKKVHYICAGNCGGVSDHSKDCEDELCDFYGHALHECDCQDGLHRQNIPTGAEPVGV